MTIVFGETALTTATPEAKDVQFIMDVRQLKALHVAEGSPRSRGGN